MRPIDNRVIELLRRYQLITEYIVFPQQNNDIQNYQVLLTGVPSSSKEDVRVVYNGKLLYHWVESIGRVWCKIPKLFANTPLRLYALTGNPSGTSASDGVNTFEFYDDFKTNNNWSNDNTYLVTANGKITYGSAMNGTINAYKSRSFLKISDVCIYYNELINAGQFRGGSAVGFGNTAGRLRGVSAQTDAAFTWLTQDPWIRPVTIISSTATEYNPFPSPAVAGTQYWIKVAYSGTNMITTVYSNSIRTTLLPTSNPQTATGVSTNFSNLLITNGSDNATNNYPGNNSYIGAPFFITKYANPEPIVRKIRTLNRYLLIKNLM